MENCYERAEKVVIPAKECHPRLTSFAGGQPDDDGDNDQHYLTFTV
jgi:hypothetical protein